MANRCPKVSVATPSFNQGRFIEETILSVLNQDYPNLEHVIMDGASTDKTKDVLKKYNDSIVWESKPDKGHADAVNKAILRSTGDIIGWLNSDDTYTEGAVKKAVDYMQNHPEIDMVYGNCYFVDVNGRIIENKRTIPFDYNVLLYTSFLMPQQTFFVRRKVFDAIGLLNINLDCTLDWDLSLRVASEFNIAYIDEYLANFRWHQDCKSMSKDQRRAIREITQTRQKYHAKKFQHNFLKSNRFFIRLLVIIFNMKKKFKKIIRKIKERSN